MSGTDVMFHGFRDKTAVVGVGYSKYSKNSGVSTRTLAADAIAAALTDAGLPAHELDGVVCHRIGDSIEPFQVAQDLGLPVVNYIGDIFGGGSTSVAAFGTAAMAIATGTARYVVCWRALNSRSEMRMGSSDPGRMFSEMGQYWMPYRHVAAPQIWGMYCRPYLDRYGVSPEALGTVAISQRDNALLSPRSMMREPLTMEEYLNSRIIVDPLRLYDCCLETDAAVALVITSAERAADLASKPVLISAVAVGAGSTLTSNGVNHLRSGAHNLASTLYERAGVSPSDVDVAELYDAFTPLVPIQLEAYGFCAEGEGADLVLSGATKRTGALPVNTHGGHLSEGYVHGLNHVAEAVNQLRGDCGDRQVPNANIALSTGAPGLGSGLTSATILRAGS
jgi:acetyl-CoA acetyltransferase